MAAQETIALLRELERHLAAVQINVNHDIVPYAGINCARQIMADLLVSFALETDPTLPPIEEDVS